MTALCDRLLVETTAWWQWISCGIVAGAVVVGLVLAARAARRSKR